MEGGKIFSFHGPREYDECRMIFFLLARMTLLAAAVCFVSSLGCAAACFRNSKVARWLLLLVLVMIMVAVLFGNGGD